MAKKTVELSKVAIKAGAIAFDKHGRIIIDEKIQSQIMDFELPPWITSPFPPMDPDVACGSADIGCVPETVCADVGCVPETICADTACEPESICADVACEPESICTDIACEPEAICTDTNCEPESKCVDIFCREKNKNCEINMCDGGDGPSSGPIVIETGAI